MTVLTIPVNVCGPKCFWVSDLATGPANKILTVS